MPDREKVMGHLYDCLVASRPENMWVFVRTSIVGDAISLLKKQEAKEVNESTNMYTGLPITHCPKCGVSIDRYLYGRQHEGQVNYCPYCGQGVTWNDT